MRHLYSTLSYVFFLVVFANAGSRLQVGSPASLLQQLVVDNTAQTKVYTLPTSSVGQIKVEVEDYYFEKGFLSMVGKAQASLNSDFIFKGDASKMYGWVVLKDKDIAYEYTTDDNGSVVVEQVPVEKVIPICDFPDHSESEGPSPSTTPSKMDITVAHIGPYDGSNINNLQSLPGAEKVLYMDISRIMNGDEPTAWTKQEMWDFWQGFSAGLSAFNVNVTTSRSVYDAAGVANSGRSNLYPESGTSSCGINSFSTTRACTVYRKSSAQYNAGTLIHEVGHQLGLGHDGTSSQEYFGGFSSYQWCPIMGAHSAALRWENSLWQWSKGEYNDASRTQDDLTLIQRHLDYREDDITEPVALVYDPGTTIVSVESNWGQIARNTDSDVFTFQVGSGGGRAQLTVDRIEYIGGSMLDIEAQLRDASGNLIVSAKENVVRYAEIDETLSPGLYELHIMGSGEGSPSSAFSKYSSLGFYGIEGEITGGVNNQINNSITSSGPTSICQGQNVTLSAYNDPNYTYQWRRDGIPIAGQVGPTLVATENGSYSVLVTHSDNQVSSPSLDVKILSVPPAPIAHQSCITPGNHLLAAAGTGGGLTWYATPTSQEALFTGDQYSVNIPALPASFYVAESNLGPAVFVGPANNTIGAGGYHPGDFYQIFDATVDLTIKSILVYAQGTKARNFVLYNSNDQLIANKEVNVPDGESRVTLDFQVPAGSNYRLGIDKIDDEDATMYRNSAGAQHPYTIDGLISIKGNTASDNGYFYYAYNWEIQESGTLCYSPRTEVVVDGCTSIAQDALSNNIFVHQIPGSLLQLHIPSHFSVEKITLLSPSGRSIYLSKHRVDFIDLSDFPSGLYILHVRANGKNWTKHIHP